MFFEDVNSGQRIGPVTLCPTQVQLFRFSAMTWNAHRIHYDSVYARSEGYPDIIVQSHLHACFLAQMGLEWTQGSGVLTRFRWENRRFTAVGDPLTLSGIVSGAYEEEGHGLVDLELEEHNENGELCTPAWATVQLPFRNDHARLAS
jgi:acyl dehydratase